MNFKDKFKQIKNDRNNGKWFELFGAKFKIRYFKTKEVIKFFERIIAEKGEANIKDMKEEESIILITEYLLTDWNIDDLEFTPENAKEFLSEKEDDKLIYEDLLTEIVLISQNETFFNKVDYNRAKK